MKTGALRCAGHLPSRRPGGAAVCQRKCEDALADEDEDVQQVVAEEGARIERIGRRKRHIRHRADGMRAHRRTDIDEEDLPALRQPCVDAPLLDQPGGPEAEGQPEPQHDQHDAADGKQRAGQEWCALAKPGAQRHHRPFRAWPGVGWPQPAQRSAGNDRQSLPRCVAG